MLAMHMKLRRGVVFLAAAASVVAGTSAVSAVTADNPSARDAAASAENVHGATEVDSGRWRTSSYRSQSGKLCIKNVVPSEAVSRACLDRTKLFAGGEIFVQAGARQTSSASKKIAWDNIWVNGFVSDRVARLVLVNLDCSTQELETDEVGGYLIVASRSAIARGAWPYKLLAYDPNARLIEETKVVVGLPHNARAAGMDEPTPGAACL